VPSDDFRFNSQNDIQKFEIKHEGKLEVLRFRIYNPDANALNSGSYALWFRRKEAGKLTYAYDAT
jgi:hypothetical protein